MRLGTVYFIKKTIKGIIVKLGRKKILTPSLQKQQKMFSGK